MSERHIQCTLLMFASCWFVYSKEYFLLPLSIGMFLLWSKEDK